MDAEDQETVERRPWRHGTRNTVVFGADGSHWRYNIDVHHEDGYQMYGETVECVEVHQVERPVKVWEPVP